VKKIKSKKITDFEKDALKEMAEIGSGRAATALSKLVGKRVTLSLSSLDIVEINKVPKVITGPTRLVVGVFTPIRGDVRGTELIIFLKNSAISLADLLQKRKKPSKKINIEDRLVLEEIGNILAGNYLSAIGEMLKITTIHKKPRILFTFGESITDFVLLGIGKDAKSALILKTHFAIPNTKIEGNLFLLIALKSVGHLTKLIDKRVDKK